MKQTISSRELEEAYDAYGAAVYRLAMTFLGRCADAEDVTQETFYRALRGIDRYQERGSLFGWLCTIGKNVWLDEGRKRKRGRGPALPLEAAAQTPEPGPGPAEQAETAAQNAALRRAIRALPPDYRDVVILHAYGGVPLNEIAARKGRSESWGKVTWHRARQRLAQTLEEL